MMIVAIALCGCAGPTITGRPYSDQIAHAEKPLAVIGDTQRTSWGERMVGREVNDDEQRILLDALSRESLGAIAHVGDMVFDAASEEEWQRFDNHLASIADRRVPVLPAMGNHEYAGSRALARRQVTSRFPWLAPTTWYTRRFDRLGLVWLDSNRSNLGPQFEEQRLWFERTLAAYDADSAIRGVLVFCHHPPYTRSTVVSGSEDVVAAFMPPFMLATKTLAFLSGHAHGYEHYVAGKKHFIVTAGGGGPRPAGLGTKSWPGVVDAYPGQSKRPLHYLLVDQSGSGIAVRMRGVADAGVRELDAFDVAF